MFEDFNILNFFIVFFGFFAVIVAIVMISTIILAKKNKASKQEEKVVEKETIKEIVMVPCIYCGSLNPQTSLFCSTCGAGKKV